MRNLILSALLIASLPAMAESNSVQERARSLMERFAAIDAVDWYSKGGLC
ncbi:hypothetical protein WH835_11205 [Raoultella planticola]